MRTSLKISISNLSTSNKVLAGFALSFCILAALRFVQFRTIQDLVQAGHLAAHSDAVIAEIEATLATLTEVSAAGGNYMITREPLYLQSYETAHTDTREHLRKLRVLTADNPRQQGRLDALEPLVTRRFAAFDPVIRSPNRPQAAAELEQFDRAEGLRLMKGIRVVTSDMEREERSLLAERTAATEARTHQTLTVTVLGVVITLAFLTVANGMIRRDLRARERAEAALASRTEDLARSNRELEQFAYVASHDLQEPLRMVSSYTQLLAQRYQGKLGPDADDFIAYSVDGARRMQALIQDLLTYSRLNTRRKAFAPTDCEAALEAALANLRTSIEESRATVTRDRLPTVIADRSQLTQLFQNLVGNAIKYRGERLPQIHASAAKNGDHWTFAVRDNGIGIEQQYADRIFVIFQRLHSRTEYPGNGIGLAICRKIAENHGGRIWVDSKPGEGSTFRFTIPDGREGRLRLSRDGPGEPSTLV